MYEVTNKFHHPVGYYDKRGKMVTVQPGQTARIDIHDDHTTRYSRRGHSFKKIGDRPDPSPVIDPENQLLRHGRGTPGGIPSVPVMQPSETPEASRAAGLLVEEALRGDLGPVAAQRARVLQNAQQKAEDGTVQIDDNAIDETATNEVEASEQQKLVDRYEAKDLSYSEFVQEAKKLVPEDKWPEGTPRKSEVYELLGVKQKD